MRAAPRLCALWGCGLLALGANAAESTAHRDSSAALAKPGRAAAVSPRRSAVMPPHAAGSPARGHVAPATRNAAAPRDSGLRSATRVSRPIPIIGGPARAAAPGRLGGPAIGRKANNTVIDGAQVHRKF